MANESVWRKCDGIDELSFRWRCLTAVSSTERRGGETGRGRSETKLLITRPPYETTGRLETKRSTLTTRCPEASWTQRPAGRHVKASWTPPRLPHDRSRTR